MDSIPFEAEDTAGNVTRGEIALAAPAGTRQGKSVLPVPSRWAVLDADTVVSDLSPWQSAQRPLAPQTDREPPVIRLAGLVAQQSVYYDTLYLEGRVTHRQAITALTLNGEPLVSRKGQQLFFSLLVPLQVGENRLLLEARDEAGNSARHEVVVNRQVQEVRKVGARLRVAILPAVKKGEARLASDAVDEYLLTAFVQQGRFQLVERERLDALLREKLLSQTAPIDQEILAKLSQRKALSFLRCTRPCKRWKCLPDLSMPTAVW
jgi:hypothetical protein